MFVKKDAEKNNVSKSTNTVSTIAAGTTINGDLESDSSLRIDGNIIGNVFCKAKIVLGESGIIQGDIQAENADVFGTVNGDILSQDLTCLKSKGTVNGNINTRRLQIEPNATFNGQCKMTSEQPSVNGKAKSEKVYKQPELVHEN